MKRIDETVTDVGWHADAACRQANLPVRLFFFGQGELPDRRIVEACQRCTVSQQCLDEAHRHAAHGWWAGTSEKARRRQRTNTR